MGNAAQVEAEMRAWGVSKWQNVVAGGSAAGDICTSEIKNLTPVDTSTLQRSVSHEEKQISFWMFKIFTYVEDLKNPLTSASTKSYADCVEYGSPCPFGKNRVPAGMFRSGSLIAKPKMDNLLASFW